MLNLLWYHLITHKTMELHICTVVSLCSHIFLDIWIVSNFGQCGWLLWLLKSKHKGIKVFSLSFFRPWGARTEVSRSNVSPIFIQRKVAISKGSFDPILFRDLHIAFSKRLDQLAFASAVDESPILPVFRQNQLFLLFLCVPVSVIWDDVALTYIFLTSSYAEHFFMCFVVFGPWYFFLKDFVHLFSSCLVGFLFFLINFYQSFIHLWYYSWIIDIFLDNWWVNNFSQCVCYI